MQNTSVRVPGRSYALMRWMVAERNRDGIFSNELLLAVFWERSLFVNARHDRGAGFGRLQPAHIDSLRREAGMDVSAQQILMSDLLSVDAAIACLKLLTQRLNSSEAALLAVAGPEFTVERWRRAESALRAAAGDENRIEQALSLARQVPAEESSGQCRGRLFPDQAWLMSARSPCAAA